MPFYDAAFSQSCLQCMCCKQDHIALDYVGNEHYSFGILQNKAHV